MAKGLSTVLGAIILIGIAIAAGASIFSIVNQYALAGLTKVEYSVLEASLTKSVSNNKNQCFLFVKLMNTGTEEIIKTKLEVSTDDNTVVVIPDKFLLQDKSISPGETIEFDSQVFTNMTGGLNNLDSGMTEELKKIQGSFDDCLRWKNCKTYTLDVVGDARAPSQTAVSHILSCMEAGRI